MPRTCLATVTSGSFLPGTIVMLQSFLAHHPGFDGDLAVIHGELSAEGLDQLARIDDRVTCVTVASALRGRVADLVSGMPAFATRQARFYSLDAFRLRGYDKVLFCDSDLLFQQSVDDLFARPEPFIACGDAAFYRKGDGVLANTFNAGFFLIDRALLSDRHYDALLALVDCGTFRNDSTSTTDQVVLNRHFAGQVHLVDAGYNYLIPAQADIISRTGVSPSQARVLHFAGRQKPWLPPGDAVDSAMAAARELWRASAVEYAQRGWTHTR